MRTICFSKPVSELVLQTGLTRPRSWTEEVSDLGRGLFSFEFPAQKETSASREVKNMLSLLTQRERSIILCSSGMDLPGGIGGRGSV